MQVVDYYSMALAALLTGGDDGPVADTVGSKTYKEWKKYIQFKAICFFYSCNVRFNLYRKIYLNYN